MKSIVDELRNVIRPEFISSDDSGNAINLKERNEQATCPNVPIKKGNTRTLTLQTDLQGEDLHPIFRNDIANINKTPDYLIFCENKIIAPNQTFVFVVELKSGNPTGWQKQAKVGFALAKYMIGTLENYKREKYTNIEYRGLLFSTKRNFGMRKKNKIAQSHFSYQKHPIWGYLFATKSCNVSTSYNLEMFLR